MKRKRKNRRGESFIETIAAMLIISFGMLMLAGAIVASARVNNRASSSNILVVPSAPGNADTPQSLLGKISVSDDPGDTTPGNSDTFSIKVYTVTPEGGGSGDGQILRYYIAS